MHADAGFRMGRQHSICQDYAAAETSRARMIAALADGCSTAQLTDVGARILVHSALACHRGGEPDADAWAIVNIARDFLPPGVTPECLKATLGVLWEDDAWKGVVHGALHGDGIIFGVKTDGKIEFTEASYSGNMPAYPAYPVLEVSRRAISAIVEAQSGEPWTLKLRRIALGDEQVWTRPIDRLLAPSATQVFNPDEGWRAVGILSDGASSFYRIVKTPTSKIMEPVPFAEIASKLLDFGTLDGPFVTSRLKHFAAWCEKNGIYHGDDLSMAAIAFPEAS